jgi:hypothetical protein
LLFESSEREKILQLNAELKSGLLLAGTNHHARDIFTGGWGLLYETPDEMI